MHLVNVDSWMVLTLIRETASWVSSKQRGAFGSLSSTSSLITARTSQLNDGSEVTPRSTFSEAPGGDGRAALLAALGAGKEGCSSHAKRRTHKLAQSHKSL